MNIEPVEENDQSEKEKSIKPESKIVEPEPEPYRDPRKKENISPDFPWA